MKSLDIKKRNSEKPNDLSRLTMNCVVKVNRNFVGDNLNYTNHCSEECKKIKFHIISSGAKLVYEYIRENSTYAHMAMIKDQFFKKSIAATHSDKSFAKGFQFFLDS